MMSAPNHPRRSLFAVWRWKPRSLVIACLVGLGIYLLSPEPVRYVCYRCGYDRITDGPEFEIFFWPVVVASEHFDAVHVFYRDQRNWLLINFGRRDRPE